MPFFFVKFSSYVLQNTLLSSLPSSENLGQKVGKQPHFLLLRTSPPVYF